MIPNQEADSQEYPVGSRTIHGLPSLAGVAGVVNNRIPTRILDPVLGSILTFDGRSYIIPDGSGGELWIDYRPPTYRDQVYAYDLYVPAATATGLGVFNFLGLISPVRPALSAEWRCAITGNKGGTVVRSGPLTLITYENSAFDHHKYSKEVISFTLPKWDEFSDGSQWATVGRLEFWADYGGGMAFQGRQQTFGTEWPLLIGALPVWRPRIPESLPGGDWYSTGFIPPLP